MKLLLSRSADDVVHEDEHPRKAGDGLVVSQASMDRHIPIERVSRAEGLVISSSVVTYATALKWGARMLAATAGEMALRESRWLLEAAAVSAARDPLFISETALTDRIRAVFRSHIARRARGEPLAYVIGEASFRGFDFHVTSDVLIPRPETEQLVELALEKIPVDSSARILDQGTGSGAIAIGIALLRPKVTIDAVDLSQSAVDIARRNVERHGLRDRVVVTQADLYPSEPHTPAAEPDHAAATMEPDTPASKKREAESGKREAGRSRPLGPAPRFDVVVANLPYVADDAVVADDVAEWEPALALRGGKTGRELIERSIEMAEKYVADDGLLIYEIGEDQREGFESCFNAGALDDPARVSRIIRFKFRTDLAGKIRFMIGRIGSVRRG